MNFQREVDFYNRTEQESWRLLLDEAERQGEFSMEQGTIQSLQEMALGAFERVPQSEAAAWLQAMMLAEIAQQLARIATQLEDGRLSILEGDDIVEKLSRLGSIIMDK